MLIYECSIYWKYCTLPNHFANQIFFVDIHVEAQQITITTHPLLPSNVSATNYVNLQIASSITGFVENPIACQWLYNGNTSIFYYLSACLADVSNADYSSFCEEDGNSISFIYTIQTPLRNEVNYGTECVFFDTILTEITI